MADRWAVAVPASGDWGFTDAWSATDGGASGASVPVATDNVFLKNLTGVLDINGTATCANLDCTGCVGSFANQGVTFTVTGDTFKLVPGMTYANFGTTTFTGANAAGTITITTAGKTAGVTVFNGSGKSFVLADTFTSGNATLTLTDGSITLGAAISTGVTNLTVTAGTFDSQGFNITCGNLVTSNANARTLTLTGSVLTMTSAFAIANTTNLTWAAPAEISIPLVTGPTTTLCSFSSSIPILTVRRNVASTNGGVIGNNTTGALSGLAIGELRFTGTPTATSIALDLAILNNCQIDKCAFPEGAQLISTANGTQRTITTATNEISFDGCMIRDIVISGGPAIATNSIDLGNNSGITFQNFGPATHEIVGVTYDNAGDPLPSCLVVAFKEDAGILKEVSRVTSDGTTGAYTLPTPDAAAAGYTILATKTGADRGDAMVGITPTVP